ncbi:ATP-dependent Lhr-like helicase [Psychromicrobium silvestre]|uniref:ATP-dependent Lhr-like helicase n=1 Tax=Psychromicrobium silvestre TaxID=1645614 RepID=A0A7Y9LUJ9_9MICC|nr:ATP-dependent helicase [Psychromicrobium silvestre]NYE95834.1 ATP-dependent Lhr-like helicase [Psychromicrobium silvestre]
MASAESTPMEQFSAPTREWFLGAFSAPTPAQSGAWQAISGGSNALVVAPTGSGKTLAAFLWALDSLIRTPAKHDGEASGRVTAESARGSKVLYISPLKALGVDVERNLRAPLIGLRQTASRLGLDVPEVSVGVRSGDTPAGDRRRLLSHPPDILITTPESLFLMLTSQAKETLRSVHTVIIDEVHAVAGTKRGAHLAVSLERLDALLNRPAQRIGLSATVEPIETVARFLSGSAHCEIVAPPAAKTWDLSVTVPVEDMTDLASAAAAHDLGPASGLQPNASIWPHVEEKIVDLVLQNRSTIVFANSRRLAERLTGRLNEIYLERQEDPETATAKPAAKPAVAPPATIMAQAGASAGAEPVLAKAHHGSVSKEQRALIEDDLKSGRLRCVVATSSLELGIDMGLVDLVIQVESPPSVASGLQRVGRAGHQVGEVSQGILFPKHRADLLHSTVTVERMLAGRIEPLYIPANPLDILAQQTVAATALGSIDVEEWFATVRRSAPFSALPRSAYDATLDLLAGRYPSDEFAELRPRIIWDRNAGTITGRPGSQRLAVTSGGTIPDRGLFGVYLVGAEEGKNSRRVGELDEEMVYESRVGDVFALGATSWRIEDITHDRVLVSPAFGQPGKLPFWKGDSLGRPVELGKAIGAFMREVSGASRETALARCTATGLDDYAANNLLGYLEEQRQATGLVPDDRTLLVERFQDELGDWRVVLHSPFGMPVHAPWALAVGARLQERYGLDGSAMASDDGIVLRVPMMDDEPPGAELFRFEADELESVVTAQVGGSALFASRFRECAARALLLPRQNPAKRSPLWQQRQRSAQLLDVARKYPTFPIILETVRECLQDVYDLPALKNIALSLERRELRLVEITTPQPSPFSRSLLFGYVASFLYEGDSPLAERRAAALSLDPALLNELLGRAELRELLDAKVIAQTEAELQRTAPERKTQGIEGIADLLRQLGPLSLAEISARLVDQSEDALDAQLKELLGSNRAFRASIAGQPSFAAVEDAARLRDALGTPLPMGIPLAFIEPVADPLGDLISRFARTHGPFLAAEAATRLGLGIAVVLSALERLAVDGRVVQGEFRPESEPGWETGAEWCDVQVLRRIRQRSLAALRSEVEPVDRAAYARFLPSWQHVSAPGRPSALRGAEGILTVVDQLAGLPVPASALEPLVLASRVRDYSPSLLDELMASGEVLWSGSGALPGNDGWISLHLAESAALTLRPEADYQPTEIATLLLELLGAGGAYFFHQLRESFANSSGSPADENQLTQALWDLVWAGRIGNDTFAPVRAMLAGGHTAHRQQPQAPRLRPQRLQSIRSAGRYSGLAAPARAAVSTAATMLSGRWSVLTVPELEATIRAHGMAELLLDRYGVVSRGSVAVEGEPGGFALMYKMLARLEEQGRCRRGYFIEKLGAAQFAVPATVDRLRSFAIDFPTEIRPNEALLLAATDPANPYGAALAWPALEAGHRPGRKAGALVIMVDGELVLYVERGGKTVLCFSADEAAISAAGAALVSSVLSKAVDKLAIEKVNGEGVLDTVLAKALLAAGAYSTPRGVRIRA